MIRQPSTDTSKELPRLKVAVFCNGKFQRFEEIPDPREKLCGHFNTDSGNERDGYRAFPASGSDGKRQKRPGWQVIVVDRGRATCYLKGVPVRIAKEWVEDFNNHLDDRGIAHVRAFACSAAADTVIERNPSGTASAKKRKGGAE